MKYKTLLIPPGETIKEMMQDRGMSRGQLCKKMHITIEDGDRLMRGEIGIDFPMALSLFDTFGLSPLFWENLEKRYRHNFIRKERKYGGSFLRLALF